MLSHYTLLFVSVFLCICRSSNSQIITVTQRINNCSLTSSTRASDSTTTTTGSTSAVSPRPTLSLDDRYNNGKPFLILVHQADMSGWIKPRQVAVEFSWLMSNGNTTVDCSSAAEYRLTNGQLRTNGTLISTFTGETSMAFRAVPDVGNITTTLSVSNGTLNWINSNFTDGFAQFYKLPPGLMENALVLAKFIGPMVPRRSWSPVILVAEPGKMFIL